MPVKGAAILVEVLPRDVMTHATHVTSTAVARHVQSVVESHDLLVLLALLVLRLRVSVCRHLVAGFRKLLRKILNK